MSPQSNVSVFTKNRERLLTGEIAQHFFEAVLAQAESEGLVSSEHFTVDGTLIEAWASQKSFVRKDEKRRDDDGPGNPTVNFRGEKWSNQTHASTTDPDARLAGMKGQGARLAYQGHVVTTSTWRARAIQRRRRIAGMTVMPYAFRVSIA